MDTKVKSKNSKLLFPFLFFLMFVCGCGKTGIYEKIVENKSGYDIWVIAYSNYKSAPDSIQIKKGTLNSIGKIFPDDVPETCESLRDSVSCVISGRNDLKVTIDLGNSGNYTYSRSGSKSKGYHVECRATINDADIVPK